MYKYEQKNNFVFYHWNLLRDLSSLQRHSKRTAPSVVKSVSLPCILFCPPPTFTTNDVYPKGRDPKLSKHQLIAFKTLRSSQ